MDTRGHLINNIISICVSHQSETGSIKEALTILLDDYEINERVTDVVPYAETRNEELLKRFIIAKVVKGLSERTIKYYTYTIKSVLASIGKVVDDITADDVRLYLAYRHMRDKVTKITAENELRIMRSFFGYLHLEELIPKDPTKKVEKTRVGKMVKDAHTEIEIETMRGILSKERDKALFELLLSTGCRGSEIAKVQLPDIRDRSIKVMGKGDKERIVYINAKAAYALGVYLQSRKSDSLYLFPSPVKKGQPIGLSTVELVLKNIQKQCNIHTHPHKLRRTCATLALKRGMQLEQISQMLGHERLDTTKIYLDMSATNLEHEHQKYVV